MGILHRDSPTTADGLEVRYISDLRFDGDRTISGTVMRYGDVADLPWGESERFEPGAFGNIRNADVVLNVQHSRLQTVARTGGGGLELTDSPTELRMTATLANTSDAKDAIEKVRSKILRGLSVEFRPTIYGQRRESGKDVTVITKAELRGIGIVDRPAYHQSRLNREEPMDEAAIRQIVNDAIKQRQDGGYDVDVNGLARSLGEGIKSSVDEAITASLQQRDDEAEARQTAEAAATKAREDAEANAETRADLLVLAKGLLPTDFETRGKSNKDILVAAVGDEVTDAANRSEDYLQARLETIVERREDAADRILQRSAGGTGRERDRQRRASAAARPLNPYTMPRPTAAA